MMIEFEDHGEQNQRLCSRTWTAKNRNKQRSQKAKWTAAIMAFLMVD
jgi:hypothetical protein